MSAVNLWVVQTANPHHTLPKVTHTDAHQTSDEVHIGGVGGDIPQEKLMWPPEVSSNMHTHKIPFLI